MENQTKNMIQITSVLPQEKGRVKIAFENGMDIMLYRKEIRGLQQPDGQNLMIPGAFVSEELYNTVLYKILGVRAKKRALFLLEQMDRTRQQLIDKLKQNGYPQVCIDEAISYVEKYHYIDDMRYAKNYIRYRQEKKSRRKLMADLAAKGVKRDIIALALEEEYEADETEQIRKLLEKRKYAFDNSDKKEMRRTYQFLLRRGFCSADVLRVMQAEIYE